MEKCQRANGYWQAKTEQKSAEEKFYRARYAVCHMRPRTVAGVIAALHFLRRAEQRETHGHYRDGQISPGGAYMATLAWRCAQALEGAKGRAAAQNALVP